MPILRIVYETSESYRLIPEPAPQHSPSGSSSILSVMSESQPDSGEPALTPEEANRIIHSHRKVRYGTACWPCRQRKVKCDNKHPCENCVKRDHANLCSYKPKQHASDAGSASAGGTKRAHSPGSESSSKRADDKWSRPAVVSRYPTRDMTSPHPGYPPTTPDPLSDADADGEAEDEGSNESRYLGQNSIAAFLSEEARAGEPSVAGDQDVIKKDIMPILGLQISTSPYPFMSPDDMDRIRQHIASVLPPNREVLKTFQLFKQIVQPFWGLLIDIEEFETKLCTYLEDRTTTAKHPETGKGVSSAWLGLVFAVLAVATNYCELPYHKRVETSQTFVQTSFHCLRLSNFFLRPSLDSLQALIILGLVLANDMKAEASWALLGLTCRLAQALGLHRGPGESTRLPAAESDLPRRRLWWSIVWQDSLLSLSFDRCPIAVMTRCQIPLGPRALVDGMTYTEVMYILCQKILESFNNDSNTHANYDQIIADSIEVEGLRQRVHPNFRTKEGCKSVTDRLHHYAIRLHTAFVISVLCRPSLRRGVTIGIDAAQKDILFKKCKETLTETVRMYLKMHSLSIIPTRSWAFTYHGLSSAVLLGIVGETKTDLEVRQLQGDLISALSATAAKEQPSTVPKSDKDIELSGPLSRALAALKNIYDHGWVVETKPAATGDFPLVPEPESQFDPHQSAALTMASLQNGMAPPVEYAPQMPLDMSGMPQSAEQTMNMSPMDLFDSIFWEPYPNGLDATGFDYSQQPMYPQF